MTDSADECIICEEKNSFYKQNCISCLKQRFENDISDVTFNDIYIYILSIDENSIMDVYKLKELYDFRKYVHDNLFTQMQYNKRLNVKCNCGEIHARDLSHGNDHHAINCKDCGPICSNCTEQWHENMTCEDFNKYRLFFKSATVQSWLKQVVNEKNEEAKLLLNYEGHQQTIKNIKQQDIRQCPYVEYETARKYERSKSYCNKYKLTNTYTKKNWHLVACQSAPTMKTNCSNVTCDNRHISQQNTKYKCCGRSSKWDYWKKVKPEVLNQKIKKVNIKRSDMMSITFDDYNYKYKCYVCKKNTKLMSFKCLDPTCVCHNKKICIGCLFHENVRDKIIIHYRGTDNDGDYEYTRQSTRNNIFIGPVPNNYFGIRYKKAYINMVPFQNIITMRTHPENNKGTYYATFRYSNGFLIDDFDIITSNTSAYVVDYATKKRMSFTYKSIDAVPCLKNNHVLKFDHLDKAIERFKTPEHDHCSDKVKPRKNISLFLFLIFTVGCAVSYTMKKLKY